MTSLYSQLLLWCLSGLAGGYAYYNEHKFKSDQDRQSNKYKRNRALAATVSIVAFLSGIGLIFVTDRDSKAEISKWDFRYDSLKNELKPFIETGMKHFKESDTVKALQKLNQEIINNFDVTIINQNVNAPIDIRVSDWTIKNRRIYYLTTDEYGGKIDTVFFKNNPKTPNGVIYLNAIEVDYTAPIAYTESRIIIDRNDVYAVHFNYKAPNEALQNASWTASCDPKENHTLCTFGGAPRGKYTFYIYSLNEIKSSEHLIMKGDNYSNE